MSIIDTTIQQHIDAELQRENAERESAHESSGKLSASMLYQPVRVQVLKTIGAPKKPFDAYTLAKFKRGNDVEDWYAEMISRTDILVRDRKRIEGFGLKFPDVKEDILPASKQAFCNYKNAVGYIDTIIDTDLMQAKKGIIPNEVKSVTNAKLKRIKATGIDWHYKIQACFYALAMGVKWYGVTIASAEDLRTETHIFHVMDMQREVEAAIKAYDKAMVIWNEEKVLPAFAPNPHVTWTANVKYSMFEEFWLEAPEKLVMKKLEKLGLA